MEEGQIESSFHKFGKVLDPTKIREAVHLFAFHALSGYRFKVADGKERGEPDKYILTIRSKKQCRNIATLFLKKSDYKQFEEDLAQAWNIQDMSLGEKNE
jgi:hypothetical protein